MFNVSQAADKGRSSFLSTVAMFMAFGSMSGEFPMFFVGVVIVEVQIAFLPSS